MEQDFLSHSSERFPGATDGVCSILRCRRILGARKLLVYVRIVVAAIFDFMRRKIGEVLSRWAKHSRAPPKRLHCRLHVLPSCNTICKQPKHYLLSLGNWTASFCL